MILIIYSIVMVVLGLFSRAARRSMLLRHAKYVQLVNPAVSSLMKKLIRKSGGNVTQDFMIIYGRYSTADETTREIDIKISSLLIFMAIPAVILTFSKPGTIELLVCGGALVLGYYFPEMDLRQKAGNAKDSIMKDFPVFCMDLAILSGTGTQIEAAWALAQKGKAQSLFYKEAALVQTRTRTGMPFEKSLVLFARRYGIPEIYSFSALIGQSLKTGSSDVIKILREYAMHSWERRMSRAREKGDKASVKMIFPLTMGLTGIIIVLAYPALAVMKGLI